VPAFEKKSLDKQRRLFVDFQYCGIVVLHCTRVN